jgi:hypothetical protein
MSHHRRWRKTRKAVPVPEEYVAAGGGSPSVVDMAAPLRSRGTSAAYSKPRSEHGIVSESPETIYLAMPRRAWSLFYCPSHKYQFSAYVSRGHKGGQGMHQTRLLDRFEGRRGRTNLRSKVPRGRSDGTYAELEMPSHTNAKSYPGIRRPAASSVCYACLLLQSSCGSPLFLGIEGFHDGMPDRSEHDCSEDGAASGAVSGNWWVGIPMERWPRLCRLLDACAESLDTISVLSLRRRPEPSALGVRIGLINFVVSK